MPSLKRARPKSQEQKRIAMRDQLWPNVEDKIWSRHRYQGFTTIPRMLGLVLVLIKHLSGKGDASRVYLDLWLRAYDEGFVHVTDDDAMAYSSGYTGERGVRTWHERILKLKEIGFVDFKPLGNKEVGYVLLYNPIHVCARLNARGRVPSEWWSAFVARAGEIGATIPIIKPVPAKPVPAKKPATK